MKSLDTKLRPARTQDPPSVGTYVTDGRRLLYVTGRFADGPDELVTLEDCRSLHGLVWAAADVIARCEPVRTDSPSPME